jgi:polar amino acid transport system substrate-binding protein
MKKIKQTWLLFLLVLLPMSLLADTFTSHCRNHPPDLFFDDGKCIGIIPELVNDILHELGHEITWLEAPWGRSYREAKKGNVDILIRHSMNSSRELFLRAIPYGHDIRNLTFYMSPTLPTDVTSYADLAKLNVGAVRGAYYSPNFSNLDPLAMTLVGRSEQLLAMLERGRVDVVVTSETQWKDLFEGRFEKATLVDSFKNTYYISIAKNAKAIAIYDDVARVMLEYRKSGKIDRYFEKYGATPPLQKFDQLPRALIK